MLGWRQEVVLGEPTELGVCVVSVRVPSTHTRMCIHTHTRHTHPELCVPKPLGPSFWPALHPRQTHCLLNMDKNCSEEGL